MHYMLEHIVKMKKSSKIKKIRTLSAKQQILTSSLLVRPVFGLALTRPQLLEKTDVVQRSLSRWWRCWRLARPASSPHQSAQGSQPRTCSAGSPQDQECGSSQPPCPAQPPPVPVPVLVPVPAPAAPALGALRAGPGAGGCRTRGRGERGVAEFQNFKS